MTYFEFSSKFPTEESTISYFIKQGYDSTTPICPLCGEIHKISAEKNRPKFFHCNSCNKSFSVFTNTIFEKSETDLRKWFYAINLVLVSKKGISALQLKREIGVTYKTAWRILKQIRLAMGNVGMNKCFGAIVEIDETYIGGKPRKSNKKDDDDKTPPNKRGRGTRKTPIVGIKERSSNKVYAQVALPNSERKVLSGKQLFKILDKVCKSNSTIMTDEFRGYNFLDHKNVNNYVRFKIDHSKGYSGGIVYTNGIESFWALLKRGVYGIYHHISVKYIQNYF